MRTIASLRPFPMSAGNFVGNTIEKAAVLPISIPPRKKYLVYSLFTWGEGGPAKPGRMRGRSCTQPFLVKKGRTTACRPNGIFLLPRWANRSPPHQSPSVTASPQGEASGLCSPTRKSVPNQGTYMGPETAPRPPRCAPPRQNERAGPKSRGSRGQRLRRSFLPLSPEKAGLPPGVGRETTSQVLTCAGPEKTTSPPSWVGWIRKATPRDSLRPGFL